MLEHNKVTEELIYLYALNSLIGDDLMEVQKHINMGCDICTQILKETEIVLNLLPYSLDDYRVSDNVRKELIETVKKKLNT